VDSRWKSHPLNKDTYIGPGGTENAIGDRYQNAMNHLGTDKPMNAPEVAIWEDGSMHFNNGRHTFSAMRDSGHHHVPVALTKESIDNAKKNDLNLSYDPAVGSFETAMLPSEPGSEPIPEGHVRLYHQTDELNLGSIKRHGIQLSKARGIEGPRAIYADESGFYGPPESRSTVEFHVPREQWDPPFVLSERVPPENIIAVHKKWHSHARYAENNPEVIRQILAGDHDGLLGGKWPDYAKSIRFIKHKYGGKRQLPTPISENPEVGAPLGGHGEPEKIHAAAVRARGNIYTAPTHFQASDLAARDLYGVESGLELLGREDVPPFENGFVTNHGRYVTRQEAYDIAQKYGQIKQEPIARGTTSYENLKGLSKAKARKLPPDVEVGSPETEIQPGAQSPGLLQQSGPEAESFSPRQQGGTYAEATQPMQEVPQLPQSIEFVSPNVRENLSYEAAKRALKSKGHVGMADFNDRVEQALANARGVPVAAQTNGIGDWVDAAENSHITRSHGHSPEDRRVALALKGLHGAQKQVASFQLDPAGEHSLFSLTFNSDDPNSVRTLLDEHGLKFRTLEEPKKKQRITAHIIDTAGDALPGVEDLVKGGHIYEAKHDEGLGEFIGTETGSRYEGAREYRRILQEARDKAQYAAGHPGVGMERPGVWWAAPLQQEAEENFARLKEARDFQRQEEAEDARLAEADRADIPPEDKAKLMELHQKAKAELRDNPEPLDRHSIFSYLLGENDLPSNKMNKKQIGEFFDSIHKDLDIDKPKDRATAGKAMFQDILHALAGSVTGKPSEAWGWYDRAVRKTINKTAEILPEIKTDPNTELAFKIGLAVTSQKQDVFPNAEDAYHVTRYWMKHGEFPTEAKYFGGGVMARAMEGNFAKMNKMWKDYGPDKLREILETPITVKLLKQKYGLTVGGEKQKHTVRGAMGLGAKIGSFLSNLLGHFDPTTMDLWFARGMNMMFGNMFDFSEQAMKVGSTKNRAHLEELRDMLDSGELSHAPPEQQEQMKKELAKLDAVKEGKMTKVRAEKLAPNIYDWAKRATKAYATSYGSGSGQKTFHEDFATPENITAKKMHDAVSELADGPRNASERDNWRLIMKDVNDRLANIGIHLTNADKQGLGWFNIKDLFKLAGSNSKRNADYLDAAYRLVRRVRNGEIPDLTEAE
jgi:hypothetical protein